MSKKDSLGDRMKRYEAVSHGVLTPNMPVIIRVDGRAFHTLTRKMNKPFDMLFITCMLSSAIQTARQMQGFKFAYVQSDEATFCITDYDTVQTDGWFGYDHSKIVSITAATMTAYFNSYMGIDLSEMDSTPAVFDARAFNVPANEIVNNFLWRAKDWERNSLQMYCRSFFSHKELIGKKREDMHEMLHSIGKNWATDLDGMLRNGMFLINGKARSDILPTYQSISEAFGDILEYKY